MTWRRHGISVAISVFTCYSICVRIDRWCLYVEKLIVTTTKWCCAQFFRTPRVEYAIYFSVAVGLNIKTSICIKITAIWIVFSWHYMVCGICTSKCQLASKFCMHKTCVLWAIQKTSNYLTTNLLFLYYYIKWKLSGNSSYLFIRANTSGYYSTCVCTYVYWRIHLLIKALFY